jgi:hypothetical protein
MQLEAISQAIQAYYNSSETDDENPANNFRIIAMEIKKEFDKKYKPCWHCIVGENFGSFVTHESKNFILFEIDGKSILLFKSA